ncbi:response regulator [Piscinibacter sp. XHJ-5]|uniref:LytR/AlgR family response regulator transcription factor n=1 Tax=Piscinibacter sp. XHJ-5 TaxID=3037797 RepID=UPI002452EBD3|nr:response regulator [Piscinibacter sp. XHJ-5]
MRVLIVDDEAPARARLRRLLAAFDDVDVAGEAADGAAALEQTARWSPDVLFLDVQMPELSGLDVAASLPDGGPAVVFVTAFDRYALEAFDAQAVDYLLKPVDPARLARTMQRLRERRTPLRPHAAPPAQLVIADRGRLHVVRCADIEWLEAADNYVTVHAGAQARLMRRTLAGLLADLGEPFVRCHRSAAVAVAHVEEVRPRDKGDATLVVRSGARVPCSRQYRAALMRRLSGSPPAGPG